MPSPAPVSTRDLVAVSDKLPGAVGGQSDPVLVNLDFFRNADEHETLPPVDCCICGSLPTFGAGCRFHAHALTIVPGNKPENEALMGLDDVQRLLDLCGVAVFAASGALKAAEKEMGRFGFAMLGCVTGIGGGTPAPPARHPAGVLDRER